MPYSNDPQNIPADRVRFLLGDTGSPSELSDNEIAYLLSESGDDPLRAAARGAEQIAAKATSAVDERRVGPLLIKSARSKATRYTTLAAALWARATAANGTPYAGGISRSDKASRESDSDRVTPTFSRRMHDYREGEISYRDRLS